MKEKVIVTGGAGFIGASLTRALLDKGYDVHVVDNLSLSTRDRVDARATFHEVDIRELDTIRPIFEGVKFVFHTAALPRVQYSIEFPAETNSVNVDGTLNVLIAAKEGGVQKVVYSASSSAYGDQKVMPLVETMTANPKSPYGLQKYIGEQYCKVWSEVYEIGTVCLRYFNVYGPGFQEKSSYPLVINSFLAQRKAGKPMTITADGMQTRDFTHIRDVVRANILAAEHTSIYKGESFNIGAGKNQSINRIAELIGGDIEYIPARLEPHDTLADNSKAKEILGWVPEVTIEEGIEELKKLYL
jgi:UDP-glucose 4-epimerase